MFGEVHVFAMGFTQSWRRRTGQERLWKLVRARSGPNTLVLTPFEWDRDAREVAKFICANTTTAARIVVYAYSWGAGQFFIDLAEALGECRRRVTHAVLCDPVYRNRWVPTWLPFNPSSLWSRMSFVIPPNVKRVTWFFQRVNRPSGHTPVALDSGLTTIEPGYQLECKHDAIDDHPTYHSVSLCVAHGMRSA